MVAVAFEQRENFLDFLIGENLAAFDLIETLENLGMVEYEFTHGHEGPHDLDAHINGAFAAQHGGERAATPSSVKA